MVVVSELKVYNVAKWFGIQLSIHTEEKNNSVPGLCWWQIGINLPSVLRVTGFM